MSNNHSPKMHETWLELLNQEFRKPYMQSLREFLIQEKLKNKVVYPPNEETFRALRLTGVDDLFFEKVHEYNFSLKEIKPVNGNLMAKIFELTYDPSLSRYRRPCKVM